MARLTRQELEGIVASQRPGFRIVELGDDEGSDAGRPPVDRAPEEGAPGASVAEAAPGVGAAGAPRTTRAPGSTEAEPPEASLDAAETEPPDEILVVAPIDRGADPLQHGPGPKTIVVSGKDRRIVAEQG